MIDVSLKHISKVIDGAFDSTKLEYYGDFDEFSSLVDKECYYCHYYKKEEVNGIDRVDNTKGYTKENSVSCCEMCNRIKLVYHPLFFIEKCKIRTRHKSHK